MAAEAGFILSGIQPFNIRDAGGYKCTGYRNQDKAFCIEGAVNHIFTQSMPFLHSRPLICEVELEGKIVPCQVPQIFLDKINRNYLDINSKHPVRTINEKLIDELGRSFPVQKVNSSLPLVYEHSSASPSAADILWMVPVAKRHSKIKSMATKSDTEMFLPSGFPNWEGTDQDRDLSWTLGQYYLRPSLLIFLHSIIKQTDFSSRTLLALSGLAFKKCKLSAHVPPIFHEAIFVCAVKKDLGDAQLLIKNLTDTLNSLLQSSGFKLNSLNQEPEASPQNTFLSSSELFLHTPKYGVTVSCEGFDSGIKELCVGTISTIPWQPSSVNQEIVCISLNLDLLAMCICRISDWRMLWTSDERFANQFAGGHLGLFQNFSLHPPTYVHDISFWVPETETFNETQFHAIARCVSLETVVSAQLLDSFQHPGTAQTSLCYRLVYQSCDKALDRHQVAAMQMELRKELQQCLRVIVR
ncbi:ferredoxin-fold anticodon-binding domain-containing protein 1 isoform X3 [Python bivittatus]|nr:ferredoxin-fold anticodon-binding domain-containing protein 1 isoform X3 [Python bivittatus]